MNSTAHFIVFDLLWPLLVAGGIGQWLKTSIQHKADARLEAVKTTNEKERESYRTELRQELESRLEGVKLAMQLQAMNVQFDFQRQLHDYTLYRSRRHTVYAELYERHNKALGTTMMAFESRPLGEYSSILEARLVPYLKTLELPDDMVDQMVPLILEKQGTDRAKAIQEATKSAHSQMAYRARHEAGNYHAVNVLYMSPRVHELSESLTTLFREVDSDKLKRSLPRIHEALFTMLEHMRTELSHADAGDTLGLLSTK
jgi:hypothetical protein